MYYFSIFTLFFGYYLVTKYTWSERRKNYK